MQWSGSLWLWRSVALALRDEGIYGTEIAVAVFSAVLESRTRHLVVVFDCCEMNRIRAGVLSWCEAGFCL